MERAFDHLTAKILEEIEPPSVGWFGDERFVNEVRLWSTLASAGACLTSTLSLLESFPYKVFRDWGHTSESYNAIRSQMRSRNFFLSPATEETAVWQAGFFLISAKQRCAAAFDRAVTALCVKSGVVRSSHSNLNYRINELAKSGQCEWALIFETATKKYRKLSMQELRKQIAQWHSSLSSNIDFETETPSSPDNLIAWEDSKVLPHDIECVALQHQEVNSFKHNESGWTHQPVDCLLTDFFLTRRAYRFICDVFHSSLNKNSRASRS